jgi:hypothetical protein
MNELCWVQVGGIIECLSSDRPAYGLEKAKSSPAAVLWQIGGVGPTGPQMLSHLLVEALRTKVG